jgi:hypothetical protein
MLARRMTALMRACLPALLRYAASSFFVLASATCASVARAEAPTAPTVEISLARIEDAELEAALRELLSRAHVVARFTRDVAVPPPGQSASELLAFVRIDSNDAHAAVTIVDPRRDRVLTRDFRMEGELDEIEREELAHVVVYAVEAMLRGELVGEPRRVERHVVPTRRHARPMRRAYTLELESAFSARTYAEVAPVVVGTGVAFALSARPGSIAIRTALLVEQRSAFSVATRGTASRFGQHAVRADVAAELPLGRASDLVLGAGGGIDIVTVTTTVLAPSESRAAVSQGLDAIPVFGVFTGVKASLHSRLAVRMDIGLDVPVGASSYVVESSRDLVVLSPYAVRAVARTGLDLQF